MAGLLSSVNLPVPTGWHCSKSLEARNRLRGRVSAEEAMEMSQQEKEDHEQRHAP
jgi:hypothetical protein